MVSKYFGNAQYFIPSIFEECFTYEKQILWLLRALTNISTVTDTNVSNITQLKLDVESLQTQIDTIDVSALEADIANIYSQILAIDAAIAAKQDKLTAGTNITIVDNVISATGGNAVVLDDSVTESSENGVKSSGIYEFVDVKSAEIYSYVNFNLENKQNTLTFDNEPIAGSNNPVTSNGTKDYVDNMIDESYVEVTNIGISASYNSVVIPMHLYVKNENSHSTSIPYGTNGTYGSNLFNKKEMFLVCDLSTLPDNTTLTQGLTFTITGASTWKVDEVFGGSANIFCNAHGGYVFKKSNQFPGGNTIIRPTVSGFVVTSNLSLGVEQSHYLLYLAGDVLYTPHTA